MVVGGNGRRKPRVWGIRDEKDQIFAWNLLWREKLKAFELPSENKEYSDTGFFVHAMDGRNGNVSNSRSLLYL